MQVISRVLAQFQVTLPLGVLFDAATVAEMAALLNTVASESERREIRELLTDVEAMSEQEVLHA